MEEAFLGDGGHGGYGDNMYKKTVDIIACATREWVCYGGMVGWRKWKSSEKSMSCGGSKAVGSRSRAEYG